MRKHSFVLSTSTALLVAFAAAPVALAGVPATIVVDDDGMATAADCNAATPAQTTITGAVAVASPGDTIVVCPGTYPEQVIVNKSDLKFRGAHAGQSAYGCPARSNISRVTGAPSSGTGAFWIQANRVVIDGFTVSNNDGPGIQLGSTWYGSKIRNNRITGNVFGVYLNASGAARTYVNNNCIANNNNPGSAAGNGIYSDQGLSGATINRNTFRGHTNSAILLLGTGAGAAVSNVTITTNTSFNDLTAVNLSDVQKVLVWANKITQDAGGPQAAGSAIRIGDFSGGTATNGVQVIENTITSPHYAGVAVREWADGVSIARNTISGTQYGVDNSSTALGATVVRYNTISGVSNVGIYMEAGTSENLINRNSVSGSGTANCQDDTTGPDTFGVANSWSGNSCVPV